jgi:hypothetical protein
MIGTLSKAAIADDRVSVSGPPELETVNERGQVVNLPYNETIVAGNSVQFVSFSRLT